MHIFFGKIPQIYYRFALFYSHNMGNLMSPVVTVWGLVWNTHKITRHTSSGSKNRQVLRGVRIIRLSWSQTAACWRTHINFHGNHVCGVAIGSMLLNNYTIHASYGVRGKIQWDHENNPLSTKPIFTSITSLKIDLRIRQSSWTKHIMKHFREKNPKFPPKEPPFGARVLWVLGPRKNQWNELRAAWSPRIFSGRKNSRESHLFSGAKLLELQGPSCWNFRGQAVGTSGAKLLELQGPSCWNFRRV